MVGGLLANQVAPYSHNGTVPEVEGHSLLGL